MANIGTKEIKKIKEELRPKIDSIFNPDKYKVIITGTSLVFLKGTEYLVQNLFESMLFTLFIIGILVVLLFRSIKMVSVVVIINTIPMILTAGMMGFIGISLKPSTILIFSISYGLSIDNAINFLLKYRHELKISDKLGLHDIIKLSIEETAHSTISTAIVFVLGFSIFIASNFGGTIALGALISFTLFTAFFVNSLLLPSLILSFNKSIITDSFKNNPIDVEEYDDNN